MKFLDGIKEKLSGYKFHIMMVFGVLASLLQYVSGADLGMSSLPPAESIGDLIQQVYVFVTGSAGRAAVAKLSPDESKSE